MKILNTRRKFAQKMFEELKKILSEVIKKFPDKRKGNNKQYSMEEIGMAAFSIFYMQSPSFLAHQKLLEESQGSSNAKTLFDLEKIPTDNHIRDILDEVGPQHLNDVFKAAFSLVKTSEYYKNLTGINGTKLLALDGTWYHSSEKIHCKNCTIIEHRNGKKTYAHVAVTPVFVGPNKQHVIPLAPEFVVPQDGSKKQDCEINAAKRFIAKNENLAKEEDITILGDDLYAKQPFCTQVKKAGFHFLFVCKPQSHKILAEWIQILDKEKDLATVSFSKTKNTKKFHYTYKYANNVPLRDSEDTLKVNYCEVAIINDKKKIIYKNSFITDHEITADNVVDIVKSGRARWKVENENNNILKTKGYNLEHNFGHGAKHLSSLLMTMNLLSFLFHTILEIFDPLFAALRDKLPSRKIFFDHLKALTCYLIFKNWNCLLSFMIDGLQNPMSLDMLFKYCLSAKKSLSPKQ